MSEPVDLDAIKARCEAATPGPWGRDTAKRNEQDTVNPELRVVRGSGVTDLVHRRGRGCPNFYVDVQWPDGVCCCLTPEQEMAVDLRGEETVMPLGAYLVTWMKP